MLDGTVKIGKSNKIGLQLNTIFYKKIQILATFYTFFAPFLHLFCTFFAKFSNKIGLQLNTIFYKKREKNPNFSNILQIFPPFFATFSTSGKSCKKRWKKCLFSTFFPLYFVVFCCILLDGTGKIGKSNKIGLQLITLLLQLFTLLLHCRPPPPGWATQNESKNFPE